MSVLPAVDTNQQCYDSGWIEKWTGKRVEKMGGIIFQLVVIAGLVGLLVYVARDDRRNRALRALEDIEEARQENTGKRDSAD